MLTWRAEGGPVDATCGQGTGWGNHLDRRRKEGVCQLVLLPGPVCVATPAGFLPDGLPHSRDAAARRPREAGGRLLLHPRHLFFPPA